MRLIASLPSKLPDKQGWLRVTQAWEEMKRILNGKPDTGGGGVTLQTNGVTNTLQTVLNLIAGTNVTLTADGAGGVTFDAAGSSGVFPISFPAVAHQFLKSYDAVTGLFAAGQPLYSDISGTPTLAQTIAHVAHKWLDSYDAATGLFTQVQPDYTDLTGLPQLAITKGSVLHQWLKSYDSTTGLFTATQPDYADLSGTPTLAQTKASVSNFFLNAYDATTGLFTTAQAALADLLDVLLSSPANNDVLTYETSSGKWKNKPASSGVPTSRVIATTAPLRIDGGASADLSADRTLSANLATSSAVGVVKPDNSTVAVDGTGKLSVIASGGSGILYPNLTAPLSANFSWVNQLSTSVTDNGDRMTFSMPTNATDPNWRLFVQTAALPSPPFTIRAAFCIHVHVGAYVEMTIGMRNSGSGKFVDMNINIPNTGAIEARRIAFNSVTSVSGVTTLGQLFFGSLLFLKITDDGTTRKFWISLSGKTYQQFGYTEATGTFMTPDQAYIGCANFTGSTIVFDVYDWLVANSVV